MKVKNGQNPFQTLSPTTTYLIQSTKAFFSVIFKNLISAQIWHTLSLNQRIQQMFLFKMRQKYFFISGILSEIMQIPAYPVKQRDLATGAV